ncbi:MAG: HAMP domain-containing histidine kinase [bacterium]|nr:HAMP domain-containing histidine kinase [bacterium]
MAEMQTRYDTHQKEKENQLLRQEQQIQNAQMESRQVRMERQNTITVAISICLLLVVILVIITIRDNRALKGQKLQTQTQNEKLVRLDRFREDLTAMIVHDLKMPLNIIINSPESKTYTQTVKHYGRRMLHIVMNILDVQKFEDAGMMLSLHCHNLHSAAHEATEQVSFLAIEKNIHMRNHIPRELAVTMDKNIILRVFTNLLTNALKFTPNNGTITLQAEPHDLQRDPLPPGNGDGNDHIGKDSPSPGCNTEADNGTVRISVADNGQGIPREKLSTIFDRYIQVEARKSGKIRSTGIGLTYCKLAVESHGGDIIVDSDIGKGTTFHFTLKRCLNWDAVHAADLEKKKSAPQQLASAPTAFQMSPGEKEYLAPFIEQLEKLEVFELSKLLEVLATIEVTEGSPVEQWKRELQTCLYSCNNAKFRALLRLT